MDPPERQVLHLRNLLSLLFTVAPDAVDDPDVLERLVLVTGLGRLTDPDDLMRIFALETEAAVLVRDYEAGGRTGLVVLKDRRHVGIAMWMRHMSPTLYRTCILASTRAGRGMLVDAADDHTRRRATAELLRSFIPPVYIEQDPDMDLHLRSIFLRGSRTINMSLGCYHLCRCAEENLPAKGIVRAAVACEAEDIGILVYDDAEITENVIPTVKKYTGEPRAFRIYDSSLFPLPEDRPTADHSPILPDYFAQAAYVGRVVVLILGEQEAEHCDAREIACSFRHYFRLEAIFVHRLQEVAIAVLGSTEDAQLLVDDTKATWRCRLLDRGHFRMNPVAVVPVLEKFDAPFPEAHPDVLRYVRRGITESIESSQSDFGVSVGLMTLMALDRPDIVRHQWFSQSTVLLLGVHPTIFQAYLWAMLDKRYGRVREVTICFRRRIAIIAFKSWISASKLLREPAEVCSTMGFQSCQLVPGAEHGAAVVDSLRAEIVLIDNTLNIINE